MRLTFHLGGLKPRLTVAGEAHHVIQRGNNKQAIFFCDTDRKLFLTELGNGLARYDSRLYAYVLMTNHIHLLITPGRGEAIGQLMQSLGRTYVGHINRTYQRTGTLWEGRFKSTIVDAEDYVMRAIAISRPIRYGRGWSPMRKIIPGQAMQPMLWEKLIP